MRPAPSSPCLTAGHGLDFSRHGLPGSMSLPPNVSSLSLHLDLRDPPRRPFLQGSLVANGVGPGPGSEGRERARRVRASAGREQTVSTGLIIETCATTQCAPGTYMASHGAKVCLLCGAGSFARGRSRAGRPSREALTSCAAGQGLEAGAEFPLQVV